MSREPRNEDISPSITVQHEKGESIKTTKQLHKTLDIILMCVGFISSMPCACNHLKPFIDISPEQAGTLIRTNYADPDFVILDVRTPEEYAAEHLDGALHVDFKSADFSAQLDSLDKTATYLVYCRSGGRSAKAMALMKSKGFRQVYNLQGGILKWKKENRPLKIE